MLVTGDALITDADAVLHLRDWKLESVRRESGNETQTVSRLQFKPSPRQGAEERGFEPLTKRYHLEAVAG